MMISILSIIPDSSEDSSCPTDSAIRKYTLPSFAEPITPKMRLLSLCEITDEWRLMSLVIDRICLIISFVLNVVAILSFFLQAQSLFDTREPLQRTIAQKPLSGGSINMFAN
ncbi:unnamed protein product [Anisakis simplex]|uniref:Neurotransmitter-gated ion-channel transmembrane domain-containing protein n=1 Tax=Anisakis simplex TaxID=6269 RepID=A0A0M3KIA6_ANISI|nr:unnamed protein product [Anisakis simplex]